MNRVTKMLQVHVRRTVQSLLPLPLHPQTLPQVTQWLRELLSLDPVMQTRCMLRVSAASKFMVFLEFVLSTLLFLGVCETSSFVCINYLCLPLTVKFLFIFVFVALLLISIIYIIEHTDKQKSQLLIDEIV